MRIDRLHIENFKKFERTEKPFEFHPHFTLLVGDNGSGKTSVLDALGARLTAAQTTATTLLDATLHQILAA